MTYDRCEKLLAQARKRARHHIDAAMNAETTRAQRRHTRRAAQAVKSAAALHWDLQDAREALADIAAYEAQRAQAA